MDALWLRYIACMLLSDEHGIDSYAWGLIEKELVSEGITDVSKCVKVTDTDRYCITDKDLARLLVP